MISFFLIRTKLALHCVCDLEMLFLNLDFYINFIQSLFASFVLKFSTWIIINTFLKTGKWYVYKVHNLSMFIKPGPRGGMVDTRDLKSLGLISRAGSSPAVGTRLKLTIAVGREIIH